MSEPELMYLMNTEICVSMAEVVFILRNSFYVSGGRL
jgi:hypothetical protein